MIDEEKERLLEESAKRVEEIDRRAQIAIRKLRILL